MATSLCGMGIAVLVLLIKLDVNRKSVMRSGRAEEDRDKVK